MKYKLLVLDVDGTLLGADLKISKRTLFTLKKVQQAGVRIVLASGRPNYGLSAIAEQLELQHYGGYIMSYNGAQLVEASTGETIFERRVDAQLIPYLERKANDRGMSIFTYHDDYMQTNNSGNPHVSHEAQICGMELVQEEHFSTAISYWPCKVVLVSDDEAALTTLESHWQRRLDGTLTVFRSEPFFLEVVATGVDKSNTLLWLMEHLGVSKEEVVSIGDGLRDVQMLQASGMGIAVANAIDAVKACADVVTAANVADGVAIAVEQHLLEAAQATGISLEQLNAMNANALMANLGIQYTFTSPERIEATMPVDHRTRQPFGVLHGGATLALAETVAGLGSMLICAPDEMAFGMQVSGNHVSSAVEGDTVRAVCTIVHRGRSSHVWNVDVFTSTDKLVSTVRVINSVLKRR